MRPRRAWPEAYISDVKFFIKDAAINCKIGASELVQRLLNCPEEDIELEAGGYGAVGFGSRLWKRPEGGGMYFQIFHKQYEEDSDFDSSSGGQFTWIF